MYLSLFFIKIYLFHIKKINLSLITIKKLILDASYKLSVNILKAQTPKKSDKEDDIFDARVNKGIPDYSDVPEFRELAA